MRNPKFQMCKVWRHKSVVNLINETGNNDAEEVVRSRARDLVLHALENGWSGPPFNAIELSKFLGYEISPNDSVTDARTIPIGRGEFLIEYNPFQKPTRINFSVAHEIAHTLFSDCSEEIRNREEDPRKNRELEQLCNIGASEIQLPYAVFTNDANSIENITLENLIAIATRYKASLESLFIRFTEVTDKACAIIICSFQDEITLKIEYSNVSSSFPYEIPDNLIIPRNSKAYECLSPGWSARETIKWSFLDTHFDIYCIGISPLRKDNRGRVGIIIAPHNNEILQNRKINIEFGDATKPRGEGIKVIAQVVNTSGGLGLGFGKSLAKNFPEIKSALSKWKEQKDKFRLGESQLVKVTNDTYVFQMLAQKGLFERNGEIPLKYTSLSKCLIELKDVCSNLNAKVHMPMIGAGQAKGDWNIISGMIYDELINKGIDVNIYMLPGKVPTIKTKSSLTLFNEESTWLKEK